MKVIVKYFARLREERGYAEERVDLATGATVADVWRAVTADQALPANILIAVNQEYARQDSPVVEGDEVAFFPPVTGG